MSFDTHIVTKLRLAFDPLVLYAIALSLMEVAREADKEDCLILVIDSYGDVDEGPETVITVESLDAGRVVRRFQSW